jgi:hypothetical protein
VIYSVTAQTKFESITARNKISKEEEEEKRIGVKNGK